MSKAADLKRKKESLAKILKDPAKRRLLAKQLAPQVGSEDKTGGLGLLKSMSKDFSDEVTEVMGIIESMPKAEVKKAKKATKKASKKKVAKKASEVKKSAAKKKKAVKKKVTKKASKKKASKRSKRG